MIWKNMFHDLLVFFKIWSWETILADNSQIQHFTTQHQCILPVAFLEFPVGINQTDQQKHSTVAFIQLCVVILNPQQGHQTN